MVVPEMGWEGRVPMAGLVQKSPLLWRIPRRRSASLKRQCLGTQLPEGHWPPFQPCLQQKAFGWREDWVLRLVPSHTSWGSVPRRTQLL